MARLEEELFHWNKVILLFNVPDGGLGGGAAGTILNSVSNFLRLTKKIWSWSWAGQTLPNRSKSLALTWIGG